MHKVGRVLQPRLKRLNMPVTYKTWVTGLQTPSRLDINTTDVANKRSAAFNNADLDVIETWLVRFVSLGFIYKPRLRSWIIKSRTGNPERLFLWGKFKSAHVGRAVRAKE